MLEEVWDTFTDWLVYAVLFVTFTCAFANSFGTVITGGWIIPFDILMGLAAYKLAFLRKST